MSLSCLLLLHSGHRTRLALFTPYPTIRSTTNTHPPSPFQSPNLLLPASFPSPTTASVSSRHPQAVPTTASRSPAGSGRKQWRLCEEQRWFHEEQRWAREKESLLGEIARLKLRIQTLECEIQIPGGGPGEVANAAALLQQRNLIVERGLSASLVLLEEKEVEAMDEKENVVRESCYGFER